MNSAIYPLKKLHPVVTITLICSTTRSFAMADNLFDETEESICLSAVITSELALGFKQIAVPRTIKICYDASNIVADVLFAEIENNAENGTIALFDLKDKCKRLAAKFVDYPKNQDKSKTKILITVPETFSDEEEEELKPKFRVAKPAVKKGGGKDFFTFHIIHQAIDRVEFRLRCPCSEDWL